MQLGGIHHLTAISAKPRDNLAFYTGLLGMRLVKKTVNQDDVSAYHLSYADGKANPDEVQDTVLVFDAEVDALALCCEVGAGDAEPFDVGWGGEVVFELDLGHSAQRVELVEVGLQASEEGLVLGRLVKMLGDLKKHFFLGFFNQKLGDGLARLFHFPP